jgi:AraC-like DNA-binding protein
VERHRLQRAGPLANARTLLAEYGVDILEVADGLDLDPFALTAESRVSYASALAFLARCAHRTNCPHFGLLLGARYEWSSHGDVQRLGSFAPTLRQALLDFVTFQGSYSSVAGVYLLRLGSDFCLGYGLHDRQTEASRLAYDLCAAVGYNFVRGLSNGKVLPAEIHFCSREPDDIEPYLKFFRVPLRFNQSHLGLILTEESLGFPLPGFDPVMRQRATQELTARGLMQQTWSARVKRIVRPQLLRDDPSLVGAARALDVHPRTLRRKLAHERTTFEVLRDEVRFVLARELLDLTNMKIVDVSGAVAFATHGAFDRAFTRWSGMTPTAWRRRQRLET